MEQLKAKKFINPVQVKRDEIRLRRKKAHAIAQYKKMKKKTRKMHIGSVSKSSITFGHAISFCFLLGLGTLFIPDLAPLAIIFSVLLGGLLIKDRLKKESFKKVLTAYERERLKMVRPYKVKLSKKAKRSIPVSKTEQGFSFKGEDGKTISQFDWRQLTQ